MQVVRLVDLGEGLDRAEVRRIVAGPGEFVAADDPVIEVETDKATVEIPSPVDGIVEAVHVEPDTVVRVGDPLFTVRPAEASTAGIVGRIDDESPSTKTTDGSDEAESVSRKPSPDDETDTTIVPAMPRARRLMRERNVDPSTVRGTGPDGIIRVRDVESGDVRSRRVFEHTVADRAMAAAMTRASEVVRATMMDLLDVGEIRDDLARFGPTPLVLRAMAAAAKEEPVVCGHYDHDIGTIVLPPENRIDIGVAVDSERGLYVPILRGVGHDDDPDDLRRRIRETAAAVRSGDVPSDGGPPPHVTLSNFGSMGGLFGEMVVVPPQVAILGIGSLLTLPVVRGGTIRLALVLPVSISFDHRALRGGHVARWMEAFATALGAARIRTCIST